jgi:hypothetical protein
MSASAARRAPVRRRAARAVTWAVRRLLVGDRRIERFDVIEDRALAKRLIRLGYARKT